MFRVIVFNFKNMIKNFIKFIIVILLFVGIKNIVSLSKETFSNINYKNIINKNIYFFNEVKDNKHNQDILDIAFLTSTKVISKNEEIASIDTIYLRAGRLGALSSSMVVELLQYGKDVSNLLPPEILELTK